MGFRGLGFGLLGAKGGIDTSDDHFWSQASFGFVGLVGLGIG